MQKGISIRRGNNRGNKKNLTGKGEGFTWLKEREAVSQEEGESRKYNCKQKGSSRTGKWRRSKELCQDREL